MQNLAHDSYTLYCSQVDKFPSYGKLNQNGGEIEETGVSCWLEIDVSYKWFSSVDWIGCVSVVNILISCSIHADKKNRCFIQTCFTLWWWYTILFKLISLWKALDVVLI